MTDKIYWSDFPEEVQQELASWMDDPTTQERLAALEKTYEVIMQEYDCTREEAVQRYFCDVMDNLPETDEKWKVKRRKLRKLHNKEDVYKFNNTSKKGK